MAEHRAAQFTPEFSSGSSLQRCVSLRMAWQLQLHPSHACRDTLWGKANLCRMLHFLFTMTELHSSKAHLSDFTYLLSNSSNDRQSCCLVKGSHTTHWRGVTWGHTSAWPSGAHEYTLTTLHMICDSSVAIGLREGCYLMGCFWNTYTYMLCDKVLLCSQGWPQTQGHHASASWVPP